jgi:hypothetical protein
MSSIIRTIGIPDNAVELAKIVISDINEHDYRTNPDKIKLIELYPSFPTPLAYAFFVINEGNQDLTVQVIGNITDDKRYTDYDINTPDIVPANNSGYFVFPFESYPTNFVSVKLKYSIAPSPPATVTVLLLVFYKN